MTNNQLTDEELQTLIIELQQTAYRLNGTNSAYLMSDAIKPLRELQERRKAAMDSEPGCLPLDYLHGHKDGLEWAARLAEANHPDTGDWLYDDPIELAKAIRKGPDMPPVQPVADSEPVIVVGDDGGDALSYRRLIQSFEPGTKLYRHAQPAPVVPEEMLCDFYEVNNRTDLVRELVKHVEQLQDSARRNVKPWEDTFPETLLPAYIDRVKQADDACRAAMLNQK